MHVVVKCRTSIQVENKCVCVHVCVCTCVRVYMHVFMVVCVIHNMCELDKVLCYNPDSS